MPDINLLKDTTTPDAPKRPAPPPPPEPPLTDPKQAQSPAPEGKLPSRFSLWLRSLRRASAEPAKPKPADPKAPSAKPPKLPKIQMAKTPPQAEDIFQELDRPKVPLSDSPPIPKWPEAASQVPQPSPPSVPAAPTPAEPKPRPVRPKSPADKPAPASHSFFVDLLPNEFRTRIDPKSKLISLGLTVVITVAAIAAATGLLIVYQSSILKKIEAVRVDRSRIEQEISTLKPRQREALAIRTRTQLVQDMLDSHIYWTKFFELLEKNTINDVYYSGAFAGSLSGQITLTAIGTSFDSPARQLLAFRAATDFVSDVSITNASSTSIDTTLVPPGSLPPKQVSFSVTLKLVPDIFTYSAEDFAAQPSPLSNTNSRPVLLPTGSTGGPGSLNVNSTPINSNVNTNAAPVNNNQNINRSIGSNLNTNSGL